MRTPLPPVSKVAKKLQEIQRTLNEDKPDVDVRLQVYASGRWFIRVGAPDYDQDHYGFWGVGVLHHDFDTEGVFFLANLLVELVDDEIAIAEENT